MKNKIFTLLIIFFLVSSCAGFKLKRSDGSDEFLIEKKNPLVMPPDIKDLPKPNQNINENNERKFEDVLKKGDNENQTKNISEGSSLKKSIIKKA